VSTAPAPSQGLAPAAAAAPSSQRLRVLIVDDSAEDRNEQRGLLLSGSALRFAFSEAELGAPAIAAVLESADGPPDCILLDYYLPDMDAPEVLAALCDSDGAVRCPVVVLTGSSDPQLGHQVLRCGAQDHLPKAQLTALGLMRAVTHAIERWTMARELRQGTRLLALREREFRALADNSPDVLTRFDRQLRHIFVNNAITAITGRTPTELIGKTHRELGMPLPLVEQWEAGVQSVLHTGQPGSMSFPWDGPTGRRHFSTRLVPEFAADGSVEHVLGVTHDVTALRQLEQQSHDSAQRLREVDRHKDEFIAMLSHELRGPLAPIHAGLKLLWLAQKDSPVFEQTHTMMERQLQHLVRLVDDLFDVSRIGTGKLTLYRARITLQTVVEHAVETTAAIFDSARHRLELQVAEQPVWLDADPTRLAQVLSNLLTNAAKYTPPGGNIALFAGVEGPNAVLRVSDNGCGIALSMQQHIFGMFAQIDAPQAKAGLGIGLALVRQLLQMHGGDVTCHSAGIGHGSTFTAWLPLYPSAEPADDAGNSGIAVDAAETGTAQPGATEGR